MSTRWGLLTNHALVLIHVTEHRRSTLREIASDVGITERAALSILRALEEDRIIGRRKEGRRNVYNVDMEALMAHRSHGQYTIEQIATALLAISGRTSADVEVPAIGVPATVEQLLTPAVELTPGRGL
ncbi:MAG: helix-turn-helix transcriptional regulator [Gemmatimonadaceae bacterium]